MDPASTIYDFCWSEEQGLWATENGEPTVLIEASVRERDPESDDFESDDDYREFGRPVGDYLVAENIEYQPGNGVINDDGRVIFGEPARKFIEARAELAQTCVPLNLGA